MKTHFAIIYDVTTPGTGHQGPIFTTEEEAKKALGRELELFGPVTFRSEISPVRVYESADEYCRLVKEEKPKAILEEPHA